MKYRLGRLFALIVACVSVAVAMAAPTASAAEKEVECIGITGSGSSLQALAQQQIWSVKFKEGNKAKNVGCKNLVELKYIATSSGKGLNCWGATEGALNEKAKKECGTPGVLDDEIGTDVGPEQSQIENIETAGGNGTEKNPILTVPVAQSAVAVVVSLPASCEPTGQTLSKSIPKIQLKVLEELWRFSKGTLAQQIKLGNGNGWTGSGCQTAPSPILFARSKASGTTAGFKRFLHAIEPADWPKQTENAKESESAENWPNSQIKTVSEKSSEQATRVFENPNSTSYVDISDARNNNFGVVGPITGAKLHETTQGKFLTFIVEVQNNKANPNSFASPETETGGANCGSTAYEGPTEVKLKDPGWSKAIEKNSTSLGAGEYSICTLTFQVAWHKYSLAGYANSALVANTVFSYLRLVVTGGQTAEALEKIHFAPVPSTLQSKIEEGVNGTNLEE